MKAIGVSESVNQMRRRLEVDDLDGFLMAYEQYVLTVVFEPAAIPLTQVEFPSALRRTLEKGSVAAKTLETVSRLVLNGNLLLVEDDLRELINQSSKVVLLPLAKSAYEVPTQNSTPTSVQTAKTFLDRTCEALQTKGDQDSFQMKRISIISTFTVRSWTASDAFDFRQNLCASKQEKEFLRAIRQYFPSMQSYPNIALSSFINLDDIGTAIPTSFREFAWHSKVDILLCTNDEDPVAGFELDSLWHDNDDAARRDDIKNKLFQLAGLPLFRIRSVDPGVVCAEDFYDLLNAEPALETIRPRRMRPRRSHDGLAPGNAAAVRRR